VVLCSGKVYFDLLEERDARGIDDVYLLRLEQFYPFPALS
jgi:2-oxoglutarate dehydrogenase E1 component